MTCSECDEPITGQRITCSKGCKIKRDRRLRDNEKVKAYKRRVQNTEAGRAYRRQYGQRPEVKARTRESQRRRYKPVPPRVTAARRKLRRAARGTTGGKNRWVQGHCARCGSPFLTLGNGPSLAAYCSEQCSVADSRARYRARKRSAFVERVYRHRILERDRWTCQLCGVEVDKEATVPHPLAAVLDHVVPLARGGTHSQANVQCAHFLCNSRKSDGILDPEQLRLIA
jgi:5-methylcytosine-specific restriction endonuclease McrA